MSCHIAKDYTPVGSSILFLIFYPSLTAYPSEMIATAKSAERVANFI
jgi:hypothetical protein